MQRVWIRVTSATQPTAALYHRTKTGSESEILCLYFLSCICDNYINEFKILWRVYPLLGNDSLAKHIPAEANARNNRTYIARQRRNKHASSTIQTVFSVGSVPRGYKRAQSEDAKEYRTVIESSRIECSELAAAEMTRKELDDAKKTSRVIWSYSEIVINPLPGYD
jgi:hypothetical protein